VAELSMLCGYDDDLAKQATATSNRIRGLLTQIHPGLETVIGPHLDHPAMLALLAKYPTPKALRHAGKHRVETLLRKKAPRAWKTLGGGDLHRFGWANRGRIGHRRCRTRPAPVGDIAGTDPHRHGMKCSARIEELVKTHPPFELLTSMPAVGVRTSGEDPD
jgi:hypothetical protein